MKAKYQKGGKPKYPADNFAKGEYGNRLYDKRNKLRGKIETLEPGWEKDRLTKKVGKVEGRMSAKANKAKHKKYGYNIERSINQFRQTGGKVKTSLQYNPNYPTTQNKPSPHSKLKLDKAIARDSTSIANRGPIGDFFDDGTETSTSRKLQVNREYRDKVNNADSKTTAKKINTMKNKKQMGGSIVERMRNAKGPTSPKKMTGQETKDLGKKKLAAGRTNRRTARNMDGVAKSIIKSIAKGQRQEGRALKKTGRKIKRSDRQDKAVETVKHTEGWLQTGGSKEVVFGAPKKDKGIARRLSPKKTLRQKQTEGNRQFDESMKRKIAEEGGVRGREKRTMQKGGARDKKFLGGLAGAIGGAKNGGGIGGLIKGGLGGGMIGRAIGGLKGGIAGMKDGGGLKGFLGGAGQGVMGGAFGNSNPMAQQQAQQAQGADPAMAQDPAMQDPAAAQMAQRGGFKRFKAKQQYKKGIRQRKNQSGKIFGNKEGNCFQGNC